MPSLETELAYIQEQIDAIKGDVPGVPPAQCSIAGLKEVIATHEANMREMRTYAVTSGYPFQGTTMSLKLGNGNMPSLAGINPAVVVLINAIGTKPAAVVVGNVTVSVSGSNSIVVSVPNETDIMVVAAKLAAFAASKGVTVDVGQVLTAKASNLDKAEQFLEIVQLQENIIAALSDLDVPITPVVPSIGVPSLTKKEPVDVTAILDVEITGTAPVTVSVIWDTAHNSTPEIFVLTPNSFPLEHEYEDYGNYVVTVNAHNAAGPANPVTANVNFK